MKLKLMTLMTFAVFCNAGDYHELLETAARDLIEDLRIDDLSEFAPCKKTSLFVRKMTYDFDPYFFKLAVFLKRPNGVVLFHHVYLVSIPAVLLEIKLDIIREVEEYKESLLLNSYCQGCPPSPPLQKH